MYTMHWIYNVDVEICYIVTQLCTAKTERNQLMAMPVLTWFEVVVTPLMLLAI